MNTQIVRIRLIEMDLRLKDLAAKSGIDYDRLQKVINNYRPARAEESQAIARVLGLSADQIEVRE